MATEAAAITGAWEERKAWPMAGRIGFRFVFCYLVLFNLPFPLGSMPGRVVGLGWYSAFWHRVAVWTGAKVLHLAHPITVFSNGSGDTTYNYVQLLCFVVIAAMAALIWTALDRRRREYRRLNEALRIYIRYALAFTMVAYGMDKVVKLQFPDTSLMALLEPFGKMSPANLLWRFMGFSTAYTHLAGWAETIGAVLLLTRRTATLGALILVGVLTNVVALNFFYDVPVKIFSSMLLLMAIWLALPDAGRLINFFVRNRRVEAARLDYPWKGRRAAWVHWGLKGILLASLAFTTATFVVAGLRRVHARQPGPLYGIYVIRNGSGPAAAWTRFVFDKGTAAAAQTGDGSLQYFEAKYDAATGGLELRGAQKADYKLSVAHAGDGGLALTGAWAATLEPVPISDYLLVTRGFHWINEHPLFR